MNKNSSRSDSSYKNFEELQSIISTAKDSMEVVNLIVRYIQDNTDFKITMSKLEKFILPHAAQLSYAQIEFLIVNQLKLLPDKKLDDEFFIDEQMPIEEEPEAVQNGRILLKLED